MEQTYKIFPNVKIGPGAEIGEFCLIGVPPRGHKPGELETVIGANAVIRSHSVIYAGNKIGDDFQCGHAAILRESNVIGNHVSIGTRSTVEHHIEIGNGVRIQGHSGIAEYSVLEDECWLGPYVLFTNTPRPTCKNAKQCVTAPRVGRKAILAGRVTLAPGVTVGEGAFVGLGCLVSKDVPAFKFVAGPKATVIGDTNSMTCPFDASEEPCYHDAIQYLVNTAG